MPAAPTDAWHVSEDAWPEGGSPREKLRHLLRWTILAPSGHNTQPWLFRIRDDEVEILPDLRRALPDRKSVV